MLWRSGGVLDEPGSKIVPNSQPLSDPGSQYRRTPTFPIDILSLFGLFVTVQEPDSYAEMLAAARGGTPAHFFRAACQFITTVMGGDEDESSSEMLFTRNRPSAVTS